MYIIIDINGARLGLEPTLEKAMRFCDLIRRTYDYYANVRWID